MNLSSRIAHRCSAILAGLLTAVPLPATASTPPQGEVVIPGIAELGVVMKRAEARDKAGDFRQAERDWRDALARRIALLGPRDPEIATGMGHLAANLEKQGRWRDAEVLRRDALALLEAAPDATHSAVGMAQSLLSLNLTRQGRTAEAATTAYAALATWRKDGEDTLDAAWGFNGVGAALVAQEKFAEAEPFYRRALDIRRRRLGEADPDTATSCNNLGTLLARMGRTDEAVVLLRRALAAREDADSVGTLTAQTAFNLGVTLDGDGRAADATVYLDKALAIWRAHGGADGIDAAAAYNALGMNDYHLGRYDQAEALFRHALSIRKHLLGEEHGDTAETYANLAVDLTALGRYREALALHQKGLTIRDRAFGATSIPVADSAFNLAAIWRTLAYDGEAARFARLAYEIYLLKLGASHPRTKAAGDIVAAVRRDEETASARPAEKVDGLRKGMAYGQARLMLLAAGWRYGYDESCSDPILPADEKERGLAPCDRLPELARWPRVGDVTLRFVSRHDSVLEVRARGDMRQWLRSGGTAGLVVTDWYVRNLVRVPSPAPAAP